MKKIILIILLIVLIAIGATGAFLFLNKPQIIEIQDIKVSYVEKPLNIDITYPKINKLDDFNQKAKSIVDQELKSFSDNSLANDKAIKEVDPESYAKYPREYNLNIGYDKGKADSNIISIVFNIYNFEGGAHGASYFKVLNYSVKDKKEIKLADLFPGQQDYLQKVSDFCIKDLTNQVTKLLGSTDGTWIQDGAGPKEENFQFFLINSDNTITFYFPQYQVAYGAAGDFKVTMPK